MSKHDAQHTDRENMRALHKAQPTDSAPTTVYQKSATEISGKQNFEEQHVTGRGGENPGASIKKQIANNA